MPGEGEGTFYKVLVRKTGPGFQENELLPGDQIWFENPYFNTLTPKQQKDPKYKGEQGSNVFYIGNGNAMAIYEHPYSVYSIGEYKRLHLQQEDSVKDQVSQNQRDPKKFQIRTINRPLVKP